LIHERPDLFDLSNSTVTIVYLQIGGNDLSTQSAEKTATDIVSFANFLSQDVRIIVIGQLLFRNPKKVGEHYNRKVTECNNCIQGLVQDQPHLIFWHHRGFWKDQSHLHADGTHLNQQGMIKYHRSVRTAVLHASNII